MSKFLVFRFLPLKALNSFEANCVCFAALATLSVIWRIENLHSGWLLATQVSGPVAQLGWDMQLLPCCYLKCVDLFSINSEWNLSLDCIRITGGGELSIWWYSVPLVFYALISFKLPRAILKSLDGAKLSERLLNTKQKRWRKTWHWSLFSTCMCTFSPMNKICTRVHINTYL